MLIELFLYFKCTWSLFRTLFIYFYNHWYCRRFWISLCLNKCNKKWIMNKCCVIVWILISECRDVFRYIQAATSPKDIIIMVDISGSMKGLKMTIAKHTINTILDTLGENDFVNVIAVRKHTNTHKHVSTSKHSVTFMCSCSCSQVVFLRVRPSLIIFFVNWLIVWSKPQHSYKYNQILQTFKGKAANLHICVQKP